MSNMMSATVNFDCHKESTQLSSSRLSLVLDDSQLLVTDNDKLHAGIENCIGKSSRSKSNSTNNLDVDSGNHLTVNYSTTHQHDNQHSLHNQNEQSHNFDQRASSSAASSITGAEQSHITNSHAANTNSNSRITDSRKNSFICGGGSLLAFMTGYTSHYNRPTNSSFNSFYSGKNVVNISIERLIYRQSNDDQTRA